MFCTRRYFRISIIVFALSALTFLYLHRPIPTVHQFYNSLNLYKDGSQHPLTSYLARKLKIELLMDRNMTSRNEVAWRWQPKGLRDKVSEHSADVRLTVDPLLVENGGVVTVTWTSSKPDQSLDVLALYCPHNAPSQQFIDYWHLPSDLYCPGCSKTKGSVRMALFNARVSCEFRVFSERSEGGVDLVAVSDLVRFTDAPLHGHIALTGDPTQMRVHWTSGSPVTPVVRYGISPRDLSHVTSGAWRTYGQGDICGPMANLTMYFLDPGFLHDVLLEGLEPGTRYFYKYGGGSEGSKFSQVRSFTTPPVHGADKTVKFVIYGDMDITAHPGAETTASRLTREAEENQLGFVLHIGDISYAEGLAYRWEEWMTLIEPYSSLVPYMVSIGNHDQVTATGHEKDPSGNTWIVQPGSFHDSNGECGVPLDRRFHMPEDGNKLWWYSFKFASVHLIQLSSEHDIQPGSDQYRWLEDTLKSVDRQVTPWVIVTCHRPMYATGQFHLVGRTLQLRIESLLSQHKVDMFVGAHYHAYERTCKVYRSKCNRTKGIVNIVVGTAGIKLHQTEVWEFDWSLYLEFSFGYGRITANRTDLLWEFVRSEDGVVSDSVHLSK